MASRKRSSVERVPRVAVARILLPSFVLMLALTSIVELSQVMSQLTLLPGIVTLEKDMDGSTAIKLDDPLAPLVVLLLAAALAFVYAYHAPLIRLLGCARKGLPIAAEARSKARRCLRGSPLAFALPMPLALLAYQVASSTVSYLEASAYGPILFSGIYVRQLFFTVFISIIAFLFLFFLQNRLIHSRYLSRVEEPESLLREVPAYNRLRLRSRLFWGNAVTAFMPIVVILLFIYSSALRVDLRDLDPSQRSVLIGAVDVPSRAELEEAEIAYYDFFGTIALQFILPVTLLFAYVVVILLNRWNTKDVAEPMGRLRDGIERVGAGDLSVEIPALTCDELGELTVGFNSMVGSLRDKERLRLLFDRYMTKEVAEEALSGRIRTDGDRYEATVLFADIRGFTMMAERMDPKGVFLFLNDYLQRMIGCIVEEGGMIDKFMGDGILAVFGLPLRSDDHAARGMKAALRMLKELEEFNAIREACSENPIGIGIGLNSGHVIAGNLGDERRQQFTIIGDTVNAASRIEGLTRKTGHRILMGQAVRDALPARFLGGVAMDAIPNVELRGREESVTLYGIA